MAQPVEAVYSRRFAGTEEHRRGVWEVLTRHYFQRWVGRDDTVLDLGAGYCEFINNIQAAKKLALDLNPATRAKAAPDVQVFSQDVVEPWPLSPLSLDVIFSSNFFEHLANKNDLQHCLEQAYTGLRSGGLLIAIGPNIRFCFDVYWDFFDHHIALSDRSLVEALEVVGFRTETVIPQFLPFTMKGILPASPWLVRVYPGIPSVWRLLGKQFLVVARKP
jgi:SAM-dependent methyltransferase